MKTPDGFAPAHESNPIRLTWPPERFYWAVIESPVTRHDGPSNAQASRAARANARLLPPGLLPDLADQVPVPTDLLHAVWVTTNAGAIVVCAVAADQLRALPRTIVSVTPSSLPPGVGDGDAPLSPERLNMLAGPFEPRPLRRARAIRHTAAIAVLIGYTALTIIGAIRRERHAGLLIAAAGAATTRVIEQAAPGVTDPKDLTAELDRARAMAGVDLEAKRSPDGGVALALLLASWPSTDQARTRPQGITVGPDGISLSLLVPGDPSSFLTAFKAPPGWTMDEPRLTAVDTQTRLTLRLSPLRGQGRVR